MKDLWLKLQSVQYLLTQKALLHSVGLRQWWQTWHFKKFWKCLTLTLLVCYLPNQERNNSLSPHHLGHLKSDSWWKCQGWSWSRGPDVILALALLMSVKKASLCHSPRLTNLGDWHNCPVAQCSQGFLETTWEHMGISPNCWRVWK